MIPLARPVLGDREEELVLEVLRSGRLSLGPMLPRFEQAFGEFLGVEHCSAVSSGTAGLHLALRSVGVGPGDEVITSPLSFVASSNVILYEGARPVFADIEPETFNLDPDAARAAVTERTRALLPVHIFGAPAAIPEFETFGLPIVEDACESLGATHPEDGTIVGTRGHPAVFAFYANKQMTTGEGGMVISPDAATKERIDSERNQGRSPDMGWLDHDRLGFNYRMTDIQCALGIAQLERVVEMMSERRRVSQLYRQALRDIEVTPPAEIRNRSWFVFVVQLPHGVDRDETIRALRARGVDSKPYLPAIHLFAYYRERFGHRPGEFPVAEDVAARSIALPFFPALTEGEVAQVAEALRAVL